MKKAYDTAQIIPSSQIANSRIEKNYYISQYSSTAFGDYKLLYFADSVGSEYIETTNPSTYQIRFYVLQSF